MARRSTPPLLLSLGLASFAITGLPDCAESSTSASVTLQAAKTDTPSPKPEAKRDSAPILTTPSAPDSSAVIRRIRHIVDASSCVKYPWLDYNLADRDLAPPAYINGLAVVFAKSLCQLRARDSATVFISRPNTNQAASDSLAQYRATFDRLGIDTEKSETETLKAVYTLAFSHGMMESSGKYCEGFDANAAPTRAEAAEAGLFQTSYDVFGQVANEAEVRKIYNRYKSGQSACYLDTFKPGISCSPQAIIGEGEGAEFQTWLKTCPALATEIEMITLRQVPWHYAPIIHNRAEVVPGCHDMLGQVQEYVENHPAQVCPVLP